MKKRLEKETIPSIQLIKEQYAEIAGFLAELKTKQDVIDFQKKYKTTMEINYVEAEDFDETKEIEVIRCDAWGYIDEIYYYLNGTMPVFDIWCDHFDCRFVASTTLDTLIESYIKGIKWLWQQYSNSKESRTEIIYSLRKQGVDYNSMVDKYGFDPILVEEYESEHYELGYGDLSSESNVNQVKEFVKELKTRLADKTELVRPVGWLERTEIIKSSLVMDIIDELEKRYSVSSESVSTSTWFLAAEQLPEDCGDVICTTHLKGNAVMSVITLWYNAELKKWFGCDDKEVDANVEVMAWQPLPQPYKEGSEGNEN